MVVHPGAELYGSDRMVLETVRGFVSSGTPVVVVLPGEGPLAVALQESGADVRTMRMPVLRKAALQPAGLVRLATTLVTSAWPTLRLLRDFPRAAVYVSTLTLPSWIVLSRVMGHRTVCHVHEAERHPSTAISLALAFPLVLAHRVVVNSRYSGTVLTDVLPRLATRMKVIYNGVLPHSGGSDPAAELTQGLRVLYVGRISPRKGPDVAARAVRLMHERGEAVSLVVLGSTFPGYEWFEEQLHEEHRDLDEAGIIRFRPFSRDVGAALAQCDVVVVPSVLPEPFGNTAVEAMLASRPVVVSDCGGLPEAVMGQAGAQLVPPGDPVALAEALTHLVHDWDRWGRVAREQQPAVVERFDPRRYRREIRSAVLSG
ncbi:glycosyltransferase family 4 protein [Pedococcus sp. KACC 23699]|uniref:Glycosyltransferase family 4 protein n=1 Tax=Pedococcus sp. KACC 23699 TaxID=3149228 RepID=A0AAU7JX38_9MICO